MVKIPKKITDSNTFKRILRNQRESSLKGKVKSTFLRNKVSKNNTSITQKLLKFHKGKNKGNLLALTGVVRLEMINKFRQMMRKCQSKTTISEQIQLKLSKSRKMKNEWAVTLNQAQIRIFEEDKV